ncbi:polysaccharide lyase [Streptomyces sp. SP18CS02]|uniref:polysaccharide lyase n=1 Tax=Streptomyces sp. SP18CS02 TaxID=3002531 RepID=UPI002E7A5C10|nr:heparin lyase I family protein [Streptomyces sp. SP18CS02]MEE1754476.1 heparin lyase I family protein [Streptomyces sp. SP18CS02]
MLQRYSRRRTVGTVLAVGLSMGAASTGTAAAKAPGPVPFSDDFEAGGTTLWPRKGIEGTGTVGVTAAPGGRAGKAARFTMPDDGKSFRSEIATGRLPYGSYRYSFSNYLPSDWAPYGNMTIVSQWHGGTGTIPAIALAVKGDRWTMDTHWKVGSGAVTGLKQDLGKATFGQWNRWVFDVTWSTETTPGSITVWRDGVKVGSRQGPNSYHQDTAPYHKIGLYRPNWKASKGHVRGGTAPVVTYYDDISITALSPDAGEPGAAPGRPATQPPTTPAPGRPQVPASASASPSTSAPVPASAPEPVASVSQPSGSAGGGAPESATRPLAKTGTPEHLPLILGFGGALLGAGVLIAVRSRRNAARRTG